MRHRKHDKAMLASKMPDTLVSVAFQDKILRDMNLTSLRSKKQRKKSVSAKRIKLTDPFDPSQKRNLNLTLAQSLGLEAMPQMPLNENEWSEIIKQSRQRKDSEGHCPICRDHFGTKRQVLLSCSHTFHLQCLKSFEKFSKSTERRCPICRVTNYEACEIKDGYEFHKKQCVIRIQSWIRSHWQRNRYIATLDTSFEAQCGDRYSPDSKRRYYVRRMQRMNQRVHCGLAQRHDAIEQLFSQIDAQLSSSRALFAQFDYQQTNKKQEEDEYDEKWSKIREIALERMEEECPICMVILDPNHQHNDKECALLSCSHIFHTDCISSFEQFSAPPVLIAQAENENKKCCPICRSDYNRRKLIVNSK